MRTVALWAWVVFVFAVGVTIRMRNPDMTETRLWLAYWPVYLTLVAGSVVAVAACRSASRR